MEIVLEEPNEKQKEFLRDRHKHIAFGGARGGGKSWAVRTKAILLACRYAGIRILIVRRSYPELMNNHINILRRQLAGAAVYNDRDKMLRFVNGSSISFMYCDKDGDLDRLQGVEYDVIFIDEATQLSEYQMKSITACVRGVNPFPKRVYYTCNPGGKGHGYIKRIFIDRKFKDGENPEDYSFIQSLVTDNSALMKSQPDYIKQLEALPPKLKEAWLYGKWDIFDGQFFEDFVVGGEEAQRERRFTHVIKPIDISRGEARGWNVYRSYDFGYNKPFSCAWWAVDFDGIIYRILELYGCTETPNEGVRWTPEKQFEEISRIEREHPWLKGRNIQGVADPSIWDASRGESVADTAARYGIYFTPGDNKRIAGWMQCHYRLQFDSEGYPRMYVFDNCRAFIRTIPLLTFSGTNPEDLDTAGEDHAADEWRYFCMDRPIRPIIKEEKAILSDPLNMMKGGET
ncbi:MAG: phage terminase large subunit [Clostridiales bacterium]|nr:phage terminase large subunit [Clostridiales bacterium]